MSERNDGGAAFPLPQVTDARSGNVIQYPETGMSLRDWFAGQALAGLVSDSDNLALMQRIASKEGFDLDQQIAINAYALADATLAERERK